ncbi:MAG: Short-chain dehydrogenase [Bradyrhizobium sp.]|nr:Short-chain dehydrogenase [Bradyrhizobium sp.]
MDSQVVTITGGLSGIGGAAASAFARKGAKVFVAESVACASIYAGAKHAIEGIAKSAALEVASLGIRVNAVAPGPTDTGMLTRFAGTADNKQALATQVPLDRLGLAEEVADGIVFLASEQARFITGHVHNVDGGHSAN